MCSAAIHDNEVFERAPEHRGHASVLLAECLKELDPQDGGRYLDGTFGGGGHSRALLQRADCDVVAMDCDPEAEARAESLSVTFPGKLTFHSCNFTELESLGLSELDGALFDLGVSSFQLDTMERGFSFRADAIVDMRLDPRRGQPAWEFLEQADRAELTQAIRDFGEEPRWRRVVEAIEQARGTGMLQRTRTLAEIVATAAGVRNERYGRQGIHPATRSFQGIRIAVNDELSAIERVLPAAFAALKSGGVLVVISFHSLEDRIVKRAFNRFAGRPEHGRDHTPQDFREATGDLLFRKPVTPSEAEIATNPRSRSARLRAIRKR